jgi:hypothetical protein
MSLRQDRIETISQFLLNNIQNFLETDEEIVLQFAIGDTYNPSEAMVSVRDPFTRAIRWATDEERQEQDKRYMNSGFVLDVRLGIISKSI